MALAPSSPLYHRCPATIASHCAAAPAAATVVATKPLPLSAATFKMNNLFSIFCPTKEIAFHRSSDVDDDVVADNKMKIYMDQGKKLTATTMFQHLNFSVNAFQFRRINGKLGSF